MGYRKHLEAQKKYIETKKEARLLKEERLRNPRPPRLDPPPARLGPWALAGWVSLSFLLLFGFFYLLTLPAPRLIVSEHLTLGIYGSEAEYQTIKNWLEPEILANALPWTFIHLSGRQELLHRLGQPPSLDLIIVEEELAREMYQNAILAPLWPKKEATSFENSFAPLGETQPFRKTLGWALPLRGNLGEARHLFTVIRQFSQPFTFPQPPPL